MAFLLQNAFNGSQMVQDANNYPAIRLFTSKKINSKTPLPEQPVVEETWQISSNISVSQDNKPGPFDDNWLYMSAVCFLYAREVHKATNIPIGVLNTNWGGTPVEYWSSKDAYKQCGTPGDARGGWDGMVVPLLNTTIKGVIWFQGEANTGRFANYSCQFPAMIADWREKFHQGTNGLTDPTFPFGFVQLSSYDGADEDIAGLRWAQTANFGSVPNEKMPNTFMAVAMDLGDKESPFGSVHSRHKTEVGYRLALAGLNVAYGRGHSSQWTGPLATTAQQLVDGTVSVEFGSMGSFGLFVKNQSATNWELCRGSPLVCVAGSVSSTTATAVVIKPAGTCLSCANTGFTVVRYAW
eukprot:CAMPEP_0175129262 /NCGR_PEP_ID=MMETSP0087-20121206/5373_1 /TAXON_ID=136419 /ORGANISM="Unknown Unknown, Strain D1" /LENGTH=352 /DNA_ID=CAMNT_0016411389 /DNA_START=13 /DNA_END=1068 /DNA_ORIENTATION=-